jgi:hypothetical protein
MALETVSCLGMAQAVSSGAERAEDVVERLLVRVHGGQSPIIPRLTERKTLCFYAFMRTTVELPPELMRQAKAKAASLGESLKALLTRAVAAELGTSRDIRESRERVRLPLFGVSRKKPVNVTSEDIARALAADDSLTRKQRSAGRKR